MTQTPFAPVASQYPGYHWQMTQYGWRLFPTQAQPPVAVQTVNVNVGSTGGRAYTRRTIHHGFHIVMSVLTGGVWLPIYLAAYTWSKMAPRTVTKW